MGMQNKLRVGVMFGGRSGEHEVSLMSARSILRALDPLKYTVTQIGLTYEGNWWVGEDVLEALSQNRVDQLSPAFIIPDPRWRGLYQIHRQAQGDLLQCLAELDVVFPVLHGPFGEDGTVQGLLEMADMAYVGAGVVGSAVGMDKGVFKDVMRAHDIPVVDWMIVNRSQIEQDVEQVIQQAMRLADFPLFVKPANLGSSVGITRCNTRSDLFEGLYEAIRFDRRVLIERGVAQAREIEISVLGNENPQVSLPGEVLPSREFYSYEAKYIDNRSQLLVPAPLSPELTRRIQDLAVRAYQAIDCAGMARADFLLEKGSSARESGSLYLGELNTIPGFTNISMYPKLWEASGLAYPALVDRLIELAMERKHERDRTECRYRGEG
jgi:D-alanine-D-alanine ligase